MLVKRSYSLPALVVYLLSLFLGSCSKETTDPPEPPAEASGIYAVYSTGGQWSNRKAFFWKDGAQTDLSNQNPAFSQSGTNIYVTAVAISPTGDVYVGGAECLKVRSDFPFSSEFVDSCYTVLWKNGVKQYLNTTPVDRWFMKGLDVDMALNANGDIFVLGRDGDPAAGDYSVWKNGTRILDIQDSYADIGDIFVKGNDVYLCGDTYAGGQTVPVLWKNGVMQSLGTNTYAAALYVTGNDDVYVGLGNGILLKNNAAQTLTSAAGNPASIIRDIVVLGNDVYVLGTTSGQEHIIWKNGTELYNMQSEISAYDNEYFQALFVAGSDVYASGVLSNEYTSSGGPSAAVIYKNGKLYKTLFDGTGYLVDAPAIFVK